MRRVLALVVVSRVAAAQPAEFTKEFQAGVDAYRLGKLDEARTRLEKARDLDPKLPGPYRFLAAVSQAQGRWQDCIDNARKALELNPRSAEVMDTRKLVEGCRVSAGRAPYRLELGDSAAITVTTNVSAATVKINGLTYGGTPIAPRPISAGVLDVEIDKLGWKTSKTTINALPGIVTDIVVDLEPDPNAQGGGELGPKQTKFVKGYLDVLPAKGGQSAEVLIDDKRIDGKPGPNSTTRYELDNGVHVIEVRSAGADVWRRRVRIGGGQRTVIEPELVITASREKAETLGLYIVAGGGVLIAGGFVAALVAKDAAAEARDIARVERSRDPTRPLSETASIAPVRTRDDLQDARDRSSRFAVISNAAYLTGLITAGVGAYFLYKGARERTDITPPFAVSPISGGGALISKEVAW